MKTLLKIVVFLLLAAPVAYRLSVAGTDHIVAGKTNITYMAWGYPGHLRTERQLIEKFEEVNPDVHVHFIMAPMSSYFDKLGIMLASGTAPDVFRVFPTYFAHYAKVGYLKKLDPLMAADPTYDPDDFFKQARDVGLYQGDHYALGVIFGRMLIYYNKTLFAQAGVEEPWDAFREGRWTWDEMLQTAKKLTRYDENGRPIQFGMNFPGGTSHIINMIKSNGGEVLSEDETQCLLDSPMAVETVRWTRDLVEKWHVAPTPEQATMGIFSFESGKLAMEIDSSGETPRLRDAIKDFDWDVAPMPYGEGGLSGGFGAHCLVMNAKTEKVDASWRFMRFVTGPVAEHLLAVEERRCIPTRRELAFSEEYLSSQEPPFNMEAFIADIDKPQEMVLPDEKYLEWTTEFQSYLDQIYLGGRDPKEALEEACVRIEEILNED